jgi:predicted DNA-binding transcriptional regulator YafY
VRADRLVALVLLLQARGRVTAGRLAAELGVSARTVYRDLAALSAAGVPVFAEAGPGGGCQLVDGYRFPLRGLREEEAEALLILGVPPVLRDLGLDDAVSAAHRKIQITAGLHSDTEGRDRLTGPQPGEGLVHLDMPRWFRSPEPVPQLRTLAEALRQRRKLVLEYRANGAAVPRTVAPLGLVNKAGTWYLVAMTGNGRVLVFRAGRITGARASAESFRRPPGFGLARFWEEWSGEFAASRPRLPVRLRVSPDALAALPEVFGEEVHSAIGAATACGGGWRELTLSFEHERAAVHRLAGFGAEVEVLSPPAVAERLVAAAQGILSRYRTGQP